MVKDPSQEARVFAKLALRGVLARGDVEALFQEARSARQPLSELAVRRGLIEQDALMRLLAVDGEDVPDLPGHEYLAKLGEGGSSHVFKVRAPDGSVQALKLLKSEASQSVDAVKAFLAEAKLLARLDHPAIVKGLKSGRLSGRYLFFQELAAGETLQELIARGGAFDEDSALVVILHVARALQYLREQGVVHRDIKPANIMVAPDRTVKLIDLGFAAPGAQAEGTTRGTAAYLSPEQARGATDLDVRSDIYSLGATLYQMVLGELPFQGDDQELVAKAVLEGLSAVATKGGRISPHMHYFIEKMMAKERNLRYQDPQELMADIENQIAGKKTLEPVDNSDDPAARARKRAERLSRLRRIRKR